MVIRNYSIEEPTNTIFDGSIIVTRILGESDQGVTTALYTLIMYATLAGLSVSVMEFIFLFVMPDSSSPEAGYWITPTIQHTGLLILAGVAVCVSFLFLAHAYRHAPVSILVPWEYSALIWGGVFAYIFWNELPSTVTIFGATLIVSSGIYISRHSKGYVKSKFLKLSESAVGGTRFHFTEGPLRAPSRSWQSKSEGRLSR